MNPPTLILTTVLGLALIGRLGRALEEDGNRYERGCDPPMPRNNLKLAKEVWGNALAFQRVLEHQNNRGLGFSALAENATAPTEVWTAPARASRKPNPVAADQKSISQGKDLFTAACFPCHGAAGKGDGPVAGTLERNGTPVRPGNLSDPKLWEQTDGALFWKISEGRSPMPSFQESLSEEQRWQIVNYVRTLAPKR